MNRLTIPLLVAASGCGIETGFFAPDLITYSANGPLTVATEVLVYGGPGAVSDGTFVVVEGTDAVQFETSFSVQVAGPFADSLTLTAVVSGEAKETLTLPLAEVLGLPAPMPIPGSPTFGAILGPGEIAVDTDSVSGATLYDVVNIDNGAVKLHQSGMISIPGDAGDTVCLIGNKDGGERSPALCQTAQ